MEKSNDKREHSRALAVLQKAHAITYCYIAIEHEVHIMTAKKWIEDY